MWEGLPRWKGREVRSNFYQICKKIMSFYGARCTKITCGSVPICTSSVRGSSCGSVPIQRGALYSAKPCNFAAAPPRYQLPLDGPTRTNIGRKCFERTARKQVEISSMDEFLVYFHFEALPCCARPVLSGRLKATRMLNGT